MGDEVEHADGAYNVEGLDRYNDANYLLRLLVRSSIGSNNRIRGRKGTCRQVREDKDKKKTKAQKTMINQRQRHTKNNDKDNINTNKNKDKGHGWSQG